MTDFRQGVIDQLGMKLRDGKTEFSDDEILRRLESSQGAYRNLVKREAQLEARFKVLSEIAGEEATKKALEATPSEEKITLLRWLDPTGDDFLGSGMSAEEYTVKRRITDFRRNLCSQMNDEQRRRVDLIVRLSVEYHRIRSEDLHGTASLEGMIEPIIKGEEEKLYDERIGWMMEQEMPRLKGEEAARYAKILGQRAELWAPAIAVCREFTDAWKPPPEDRPRYDTWEEMLEAEPGIVVAGHDNDVPVWMMEADAPSWGTQKMWNLAPFRATSKFWQDTFDAGVRWRGPRIPSENGYWHREDGEKFPDNEEKFWGNNYHRIYGARDLRGWLGRQKEIAA